MSVSRVYDLSELLVYRAERSGADLEGGAWGGRVLGSFGKKYFNACPYWEEKIFTMMALYIIHTLNLFFYS